MNSIELREKLINEELAQLAYEQRKLEEYKQKEDANVKSAEYRQKAIDARLYRFNELQNLYVDIELNFKLITDKLKDQYLKETGNIFYLPDPIKIIVFKSLVDEYHNKIIEVQKDYEAAPVNSYKERGSIMILTVYNSLYRSFNLIYQGLQKKLQNGN